jgi:hypothetical protein
MENNNIYTVIIYLRKTQIIPKNFPRFFTKSQKPQNHKKGKFQSLKLNPKNIQVKTHFLIFKKFISSVQTI